MLQASVHVDAASRIGTVDRNLYGHFIEHLGRCINGGVWGELLSARKFVGFDDDHDGLPGAWRIAGGRDAHLLARVEQERGTGVLHLRCLRDTGLHAVEHGGLAVRRNTGYSFQLELRAAEGEIAQVELALGGAREMLATPGSDWQRVEVEFAAQWDDDDAALTIGARGRGELQVRDVSLMTSVDRATGGFRADVLELVRALHPPIVRWPGGCFADNYRWERGVGPRGERPPAFDAAWGAWEPNDFGTLEFVRWCRLVGAEPYLCVNTGSADAAEAAAWVQYCNGPADSPGGRRRAADGHPEPLGVRYWGVGNETYGSWEIGNVPADEYGRLFLEFAAAMRAVDPGIALIAVGADPIDGADWNRTVLTIAGAAMDYLSVHRYCPHTRDDARAADQYAAIVAAPVDVERRLRKAAQTVREVLGEDTPVRIAFDEWNVWLDAGRDVMLEERYELRDALFAAGVFHALQRTCADVTMANLAQLVNVLPAITTSRTGAWGTPLYHACALYAGACQEIAVACACASPSFDAPAFGNIPALADIAVVDAAATIAADGRRLALALINRHRTQAAQVAIDLAGTGRVRGGEIAVLCGASERAAGSELTPAAVVIDRSPLPAGAEIGEQVLPAHSVVMMSLELGSAG